MAGQSTGRDLHIDVPLTNMVINHRPVGMIADLIAPVVPVGKQSDMYWVFGTADAFKLQDDRRAPGTSPNVVIRSVSSDTYYAENYALKDYIPMEDIANADAMHMLTERSGRAQYIKDRLMLNWEARVADMVSSTSNVGSYMAVGSSWSDHDAGNSDPVTDILTAIHAVEDSTGQRPNTIVFGYSPWRNFRQHSDVLTRLYGSAGTDEKGRLVPIDSVRELFEVERVLVGRSYKNTAGEGQAASLSRLWGDNVLVCYIPEQVTKEAPSFMYSFRWTREGYDMTAKTRVDDDGEAEEVRVSYYQDEKITAPELGFLLTNVTSS